MSLQADAAIEPLVWRAHHIDIAWLHEAYRRTRKDAAVGVDGQTAAEYEANRPGRTAHQALAAVWKQAMDMGGYWVLEVDIEDFFGSLDKTKFREMLCQRIRDGVLVRLIGKWLNAGVVSPLLSNVYLQEVLDLWFAQQIRPRLKGQGYLTRFADDFVMTFEREEDARRMLEVLSKRFGKYGLRFHPTKTRLIRFYPPSSPANPQGDDSQRQRSFDLLGLTLYWGRSMKGTWVVKLKTMKAHFVPHLGVVQGEPRFASE